MNQLFLKKGGTPNESNYGDTFNCQPIRLTEVDLDHLETDIREGKLQPISGFFFESGEIDEETKQNDLQFVQKAREWIKDGYAVYYDSWW